MVTARPGHSLPELIVAVCFLGTSLAAVGASVVLGSRWALDATRRQEAVREAAAVLDSLAMAPGADDGTRTVSEMTVQWTVTGPLVRVTVADGSGRLLTELEGRRFPSIPALPDVGGDSATGVEP